MTLEHLIGEELARPVPAAAEALAEAARQRHGRGIAAILFYGSCLRSGEFTDKIADLYLLADSYEAVHRGRCMRLWNRLIPPNVYYLEVEAEGVRLRAKYALVTLGQFERLVSRATLNPYFWARFAQPARAVWVRDDRVRRRVTAAVVTAVRTAWREVLPLMPVEADGERGWSLAFGETYRTELRAEGPQRARELVAAERERYLRVAALLGDEADQLSLGRARRRWRWRRVTGKLMSVLRLVKAAFTFDGGPDYLAWKIARHSGVQVELTPWQRRHPLLAAPLLFWRLYRRGAFR